MSDLISREATMNVLKERYCEGCTYYGVRCKSVLNGNCPIYNAIIAVDAVPTVDAEPVKHGSWDDLCRGKVRVCSCCKHHFDNTCNDIDGEWIFCPCCGAKMDADECTQIES